MASTWRGTLTLIDTQAKTTTLNYIFEADELTLPDEFSAANDAMEALKSDLAAVSDAVIYNESLAYVKGGSSSLPADADVSDVAMVMTHLLPATEAPKLHPVRIPAPKVGIFASDLVTVDVADSDLIAFIDELSNFSVSDGENIDTSNNNGIQSGYWISVKKSTK